MAEQQHPVRRKVAVKFVVPACGMIVTKPLGDWVAAATLHSRFTQ